MVTPLTVNNSFTNVSGSAVTLLATQIVHTIQCFPSVGGLTLTMPAAAAFFVISGISIQQYDQSDFVLINQSLTDSVTVVADRSFGDLAIAPAHSAAFRIFWNCVTVAKTYTLYRIGGSDSTASLQVPGQLLLRSSASSATAVFIDADNADGGVAVHSNTGGFAVTTSGTITLTTETAPSNEIKLTAAGSTSGTIVLDASGATAGGIIMTTGPAGIIAGSVMGQIAFTTTEGSSEAIKLDTTGGSGGILLNGGTGGVRLNQTGSTGLLSMFGVTPVNQRTTAIADPAPTAVGSVSAIYADTKFHGYTLGQVVQALKDYGLLA